MKRVAIIGSGNFGSAIARVIGQNVVTLDDIDNTVKMYVWDEMVDGESLVKIINTTHENVKYLPGRKLPENIVAVPDIVEAAHDADFLVVVVPHQFLDKNLKALAGHVKPTATAVSLIKGIKFEGDHITLLTDLIERSLGIPCGSVMGANIADNVADEQFCETTLSFTDLKYAPDWMRLLERPYFHVEKISDIVGQQLCGTIKNIVSVVAGVVDGLGYGQSSKAAVVRWGLVEMYEFAKWAFPDRGVQLETMMASCGVGDLIASAYGGRNRKCGEHFARTGKSFPECEAELLNGQKLQDTLSAVDVYNMLKAKGALKQFPFFTTCYLIIEQRVKPEQIFHPNGPHLDLA